MSRLLLAAVLVISVCGSASAKGTVTAGPITGHIDYSYRCFATNISSKPVTITMTYYSYLGAQLSQIVCADVAPNGTCFLDRNGVVNTCRVDHDGAKNAVRGTMEVNDATAVRTDIIELR